MQINSKLLSLTQEEIERAQGLERYRLLRAETFIKTSAKGARTYKHKVISPSVQMPASEEEVKKFAMISDQLINYQCIKRRLIPNDCQKLIVSVQEKCSETKSLSDGLNCIKINIKITN